MNREETGATSPATTTTVDAGAPLEPRRAIPGWGADARPEDRPGVPEELPPRPLGNAYWTAPEPQVSGPVAVRGARRPLTPVYGTACPPRGLSGLVRRAAYRIPDYRVSRWMLLVAADRIDVVEHNLVPIALVAGGVGAGVLAVRALRRR